MKHKVIIADDHPIFRGGIKSIINELDGFELAGEAGDGLQAYQLIVSILPDIAILDLEMPVLGGLEVCKKVLAEKHFTRFIILTMHKDRHFFEDAMDHGVMGYLLKDNAAGELVKCLRSVLSDKRYLSPGIGHYLQEKSIAELPAEVKQLYATLTPTEKMIVKLVAGGKTSHEIAESMFISPNTVENHRSNISRKLKLEGKNSLLKFALQHASSL